MNTLSKSNNEVKISPLQNYFSELEHSQMLVKEQQMFIKEQLDQLKQQLFYFIGDVDDATINCKEDALTINKEFDTFLLNNLNSSINCEKIIINENNYIINTIKSIVNKINIIN